MTNKNKLSIFSFIKNIFFIIPHLMRLTSYFFTLINQETRLAIKSIMKIAVLAFILVGLLITTWIGILVLIYLYLISLPMTSISAVSIVLLINISLLVIVGILICKMKKNILFSETRLQLKHIIDQFL